MITGKKEVQMRFNEVKRFPIRNMHSTKAVPPRFCDVIIENNTVYLEKKNDKVIERIPWDDVLYQVQVAQSAI